MVCVFLARSPRPPALRGAPLGKTLAENLASVPTLAQLGDQDIVFPCNKPRAGEFCS